MMDPVYFASPVAMEKWFSAHHATEREILVGFHKKGSGEASVTWPESVDVALCFGWIDGVRKNVDSTRYTIRFTPRRARSIWSAVNLKRVAELIAAGSMRPEGMQAFERRETTRSGIYSYEQKNEAKLGLYEDTFRANAAAWAFFQAQPPGYRQILTWWVISAKKEETRLSRLATLIENSGKKRRLR